MHAAPRGPTSHRRLEWVCGAPRALMGPQITPCTEPSRPRPRRAAPHRVPRRFHLSCVLSLCCSYRFLNHYGYSTIHFTTTSTTSTTTTTNDNNASITTTNTNTKTNTNTFKRKQPLQLLFILAHLHTLLLLKFSHFLFFLFFVSFLPLSTNQPLLDRYFRRWC